MELLGEGTEGLQGQVGFFLSDFDIPFYVFHLGYFGLQGLFDCDEFGDGSHLVFFLKVVYFLEFFLDTGELLGVEFHIFSQVIHFSGEVVQLYKDGIDTLIEFVVLRRIATKGSK